MLGRRRLVLSGWRRGTSAAVRNLLVLFRDNIGYFSEGSCHFTASTGSCSEVYNSIVRVG